MKGVRSLGVAILVAIVVFFNITAAKPALGGSTSSRIEQTTIGADEGGGFDNLEDAKEFYDIVSDMGWDYDKTREYVNNKLAEEYAKKDEEDPTIHVTSTIGQEEFTKSSDWENTNDKFEEYLGEEGKHTEAINSKEELDEWAKENPEKAAALKADLDQKLGEDWAYDWDKVERIDFGENENSEFTYHVVINKGSKPEPKKEIKSEEKQENFVTECKYENTSKEHFKETHLKATLNPDKSKSTGKESLYALQDYISLSGEYCSCITKHYEECQKHYVTYDIMTYYTETTDGIVTSTWSEKTGSDSYETDGCKATRNEEYSGKVCELKIEFDGFKVGDNKVTTMTLPGGTIEKQGSEPTVKSWATELLQITEIKNAHYDSTKGTFYGKIIVSSACCKENGCKKEFKLYFGPNPDEVYKNLTVKVSPKFKGITQVMGTMDTDNDGKSEKNVIKTITDQETMKVVAGTTCKIVSIGVDGWEYQHIVTEDGNILSEDHEYYYTMPAVDSTLVVNFVPSPVDGYTLYVNSNEGGRGYVESVPVGTNYEKVVAENGTKSIITEKITKVKAGTEFTLVYEADEEYEFSRWEYRPFAKESYNEKTQKTKIEMPKTDLVATAIFIKKAPIINEKNPILKVTVNNEEWGNAYALVDGVPTTLSEVVPGTEYQIVFEANKPGYFFTNWAYDCVESPFVQDKDGIILMPPHDLEITAFFAPVPPIDEQGRGSNVNYVAETTTPEDNIVPGIVPEDLYNIAHGSIIPLATTPCAGYEFVKWRITDENNNLLTPDIVYSKFGSGMFILPTQNVIAHAVFKKVDMSNLRIEIIGEGSVTVDGTNAPDGSVVTVVTGSTVKLVATPGDGYKFLYWINEDGNKITGAELDYTVLKDTVISAYFVDVTKNKYTLYVSSMEGGNAYTIGNKNHPEKDVIKTTDALGKTVYKIENVMEGERFTIYYEKVKQGFTFDKWEYKPYIKVDAEKDVRNKKDGRVEIVMPASDLTVTAVFKNNNIVENPELRVTTNNEKWGTAWTFVGKDKTKIDETYEVEIGKQYEMHYLATKPGYYFVNWSYSTKNSPFISENKIEMPNKNLEVMALFSPIPEPEDEESEEVLPTPPQDKEGHKIDFIAEPEEGGSVPEDLGDIREGSKVTIGVTPNKGWEFSHWRFENANKEKVELGEGKAYWEIDGSGYFIMPNEDIRAIAVFKKTSRYPLYVTYGQGGTAWVMDGETKVNQILEAIPEETYQLGYQAEEGYKFAGWTFAYVDSEKNEGIQPDINKDKNQAVMPYSEMTVTATFIDSREKEGENTIRAISNNFKWGNVILWTEDFSVLGVYLETGEYILVENDGKEYISFGIYDEDGTFLTYSDKPGIKFKPDTSYFMLQIPSEGYRFTHWLFNTRDIQKNEESVANSNELKENFIARYKKINNSLAKLDGSEPYMQLIESAKKLIASNAEVTDQADDIEIENVVLYDVNGIKIYMYDDWGTEIIAPKEAIVSNYELIGFFAPGATVYNLTAKAEPENAATAKVYPGNQVYPGEQIWAWVEDVNKDFKFEYWYYEWDPEKNPISYSSTITGFMPAGDLNLVAKCRDKSDPGPGPDPDPNTDYYDIIVKIEGDGTVKDDEGKNIPNNTKITIEDKTSVTLTATPNSGNNFIQWLVDGDIDSDESRTQFGVDGKDITVTAVFNEEIPDPESEDTLKIISVRDLRWKDYFVQGKYTTGNEIEMPSEKGLMLTGRNKYPEAIKMGYAVEFELTTSQFIPENTALIITPEIIYDGDTVEWNDITDYLSRKTISEDFEEIIIYGDNRDCKPYKTMYQTSAKPDDRTDINGMKWNWVYYLPADIRIDDKKLEEDIIVRFKIELCEIQNGELEVMRDVVFFEQKFSNSTWEGDVFKYSYNQSVLDDIYNNAQN